MEVDEEEEWQRRENHFTDERIVKRPCEALTCAVLLRTAVSSSVTIHDFQCQRHEQHQQHEGI